MIALTHGGQGGHGVRLYEHVPYPGNLSRVAVSAAGEISEGVDGRQFAIERIPRDTNVRLTDDEWRSLREWIGGSVT